MAADGNKQLLQRVFAEIADGNSRSFVESLADDIRWTIVGTTKWSRTYDGKKAVLEELLRPLRDRLVDRVKVTAYRFIADGDLVVVEASGEARTKTGRPYNNTYCWIFRLADGRVREVTEYLDTELVAKALDSPSTANLVQAVPFFMITHMDASVRFYVDGLGFRMTHTWTPRGTLEWCWLERGEVAVMLQMYREGLRPDGQLGVGVSVCFMCQDAIAYYKELRSRGVQAQRPFVGNNMWVTNVVDPDGYRLTFESATDAPEETEYADADA
jgi:ketosteroid isomerase-like protein